MTVAPRITLPSDEPTLTLLERLRIEFSHLLSDLASVPTATDWSETSRHSRLLREIIGFVNADGQPQTPPATAQLDRDRNESEPQATAVVNQDEPLPNPSPPVYDVDCDSD